MLLDFDGLVLHGGTARRHHRDGLVALALLGMLDRLDGLVLLVLLLEELLLVHLLLLLDLILLEALIIACRGGGGVFDAHRRLNVVNDSLMCCELGLCAETFAAVQARVRRVCVLTHVSHERSLLEEFLATDRALVGHTTVQLSVINQLELSRKRRAAILTDEGIQRSVETRVHHQMLLLSEAKRAETRSTSGSRAHKIP